ncbi:hypothetical protein ACIGQE_09375 [Streptomyces sp. NPDC053429]|uniref:hypothetical protein n=1 Tax=unclassified Streptomyces TaxID=2593676 RepID=UPI0033E38C09
MESTVPVPSPLLDEARTALRDVSDPAARALVLAVLAAARELQDVAHSAERLDARLESLNGYLGAIANKP